MYRCKNEECKKVYPRDPGGAKNNTVECVQYKVELREAAERERQLAERAAEDAERKRAVLARAQRASRRAEETETEAEGRRRSLRQRIR